MIALSSSSSSSLVQFFLWVQLIFIILIVIVSGNEEKENLLCHPTEENTYDFIVIGGGTAGSALASELARLVPNDISILLLDQGKDFSDLRIVMDNDRFFDIQETPYCQHQFSMETALKGPGTLSSDRNIYNCDSKVLGGASSINFGGWYRAPESDLNEWAELSGNDIWTYDNMLPYYKRVESIQRDPTDNYPDRGFDGVIPVQFQNISSLFYHTGMTDAVERRLGVPLGNQDSNNRYQNSMGTLQLSRTPNGCWYDEDGNELGCANVLRNGSSYNAFIRDPKRNSELPNLHVREGAKVVKVDNVTPDNVDGEMLVEYLFKGYRYIVRAKHEIVMSAGSWGTPKIAMLSGIGNSDDLDKVGIDTKISLPGVGRHLLDHGVLRMRALFNNMQIVNLTDIPPDTFYGVGLPIPLLLAATNSLVIFFKSDPSTLELPDMELVLTLNPAGPPTRSILIFNLYQNKGTSGTTGGSLKLRSDDPLEEMDVTRNWYPDDESVAPMIAALKTVLNMIQTDLAPNAPMILEPNGFTVDFTDDASLKQYIFRAVTSEMHLQGSMKMGIPPTEAGSDSDSGSGDPMAVVDGELKIIGSNGRIRVADTSIFPTDLRGHPMVTAMAIGLRAASLIASDFEEKTMEAGDSSSSSAAAASASATGTGGTDCAFAAAATAASAMCAFAALSVGS